jgi:glycosyltransferase involved in cell wall biosynthesis
VKTLVLLTDGFGGHGGIAKFNRDLLHSLCSFATATEVIAIPRLMPEPPGSLPDRLRYVMEGLGSKRSYTVTVLRVAIRERGVNVVICGHINLLPLAWLSSRLLCAPMLLVVHGVEAWHPTGRLVTDWCAQQVDSFLSVSEFTRRKFLGWTGLSEDRGRVIPDCVELQDFSPGPKPSHLLKRYGLQGRTVLMTLARLSAEERYKGIDEVLERLPELIVNVPNLAYLIAGDGSDRPRLEEKAQALGLKDRVVFAERIAEEEKADHYRLADTFVMPGFGEGFGIVYLEAMACGIPVVASKADASREAVLDGKLGVVVDPRNCEELKAGILEALNRPRGVVPAGLEYFSSENFERRLHNLLEPFRSPQSAVSSP